MEFNQVNKTVRQELFDIIKFQIMVHCFSSNIHLSKTELNCLALLGREGKMRFNKFCSLASEMQLLGSPNAVINCLSRIERSKLFLKEGVGKKHIFLNPELNIQTKGNILLNYKIVCVNDTSTLEGYSKTNSGAAQLT